MDRKIIDYLPPYLTTYKEIRAITDAEQPEFELAWSYADDSLNNQFVQDSSLTGVLRMEAILGIVPKTTDTVSP